MSEDYYLICKEKKIYMPLFTMNLGGCSVSSKNWVFDFILACGGSEIKLLHEQSEEMPGCEEKEAGWTFMNAWHPHPDDKVKTA